MKRHSVLLIWAAMFAVLGCAMQPVQAAHHGNPAAVVATSIQVASGCAAVPTSFASGTTIYVNAGGSDSNPGTIGSPVKTIAKAALLVSASGGDTIALQDSGGAFPGYPSDFNTGGAPGLQIQWPAFTRITAAAGSSPSFSGWFRLKDVGKLLVTGISFFGHSNATGDPFISVESDGSPTTTNVVVYANTFASDTVPTMLGWSAAQWQANARASAIRAVATNLTTPEVSCFTANGNTIQGVGSALGDKAMINNASASHSAYISNVLNYIPDDGMTWAGSNVEILFNTVTNDFYVQDFNHNDGIQHQSCNNPNTPFYCDDTGAIINGNTVNELTVPAATIPLYVPCDTNGSQGIDSFDDQVDNATIINNQVAGCATSLIDFYSLTNSTIANNTVAKYVQTGDNGGGCAIDGVAHEAGTPNSSNDTIRNNICANIGVSGTVDVATQSITIDHNLCLLGCFIDYTQSGTGHNISAAGNYAINGGGATNTIISGANTTVFTQYNIATPVYDFNPLTPTSPAIAAGTLTGAPAFPNGAARTAPVNEGALGP